jgi:ribosomal protein S18 acetylase RimI-like enzyme
MATRPFQLPQDIDLMKALVIEGFQYPENPSWSIQEDEKQDLIDTIHAVKRMWPVLRIVQIFSPVFRDVMHGFIEEQEGKPVGLINFLRQRNVPEWWIGNVTVLPGYRRRGIARQLVAATLDDLRRRMARRAYLEVVDGNLPAFQLYKETGFEAYAMASLYTYGGGDSPARRIHTEIVESI